MLKLLKWLDDYLLPIFAGFLLGFIPLYPKFPLVDILPGYIVRVRLEDVLILSCFLIWIMYLVRGKIRLSENPLVKPILLYLSLGFLSLVSAVFIVKTIPLETIHVGKGLLHLLRRVEYFSLFFIFYSSIKSVRQIKSYLVILTLTILAVSIYGFGQKYLYWPAYSTMNREFAKGWQLYLTEHARVLSTFGGHYDLAAFIMMALILLWSLFFGFKNLILRILTVIIIAAAFWTLILTASRTSFIAYIAGLTFMFFFWAFKKGIFWSISRFLVVSTLSIVLMLSFGDLSDRFTKFLRINERFSTLKLFLTKPFGSAPSDKALFLVNNPNDLSQITAKSDQPPTIGRPSDVYQDYDLMVQTKEGTIAAIKRTYSKTAFQYDLSTAIRFDALWPQAIKGFKRNPLLGSGYSTLNKTNLTDFTEAESTDNDFLRSLGETGILGFIAFYGTLVFILYYIWRNLAVLEDPLILSISIGFAGLLFGLLVNAVYIDVFESSKVALSFWAMTGITLAGVNIMKKRSANPVGMPQIPNLSRQIFQVKKKLINFTKSDLFYLLIVLIIAFGVRLYKIKTPLAEWHSWRQADTSAVTRNFVRHGINILYPTYDDLSNVASGRDNPKGLRFVEFPLFNLAHVFVDQFLVGYNLEMKGRLTSVVASLISVIFLFKIVRFFSGRNIALLASLFFALVPFNIFFSRVVLPEPLLVTLSLGMIWFFISNKFIPAFIFAALALLVKPFAGFLFLPLIYFWIINKGINKKSVMLLTLFFILAAVPLFLWRWWANHFPEGIPANLWLLNGDGIRFKGAFFFWLFADRLARLILGFYGLPLLIFGILAKKGKEGYFYHLWGISMLLYVTVVATGNVRHDYYQILIIPVICIYLGKGVFHLFETGRGLTAKIRSLSVILLLFVLMEMFGWYYIRDFYNINHPEIIKAGLAVELKTPAKSLVIAPYNGDTAFLYQTQRSGWPVLEKPIPQMIEMGAHYYVSVNFDDLTKELLADALIPDLSRRKYKLIEMTKDFALIQLVPDNRLPK